MVDNKIIYRTSWVDLVFGAFAYLCLWFVVFLLFYGGYWWLALPLMAFIIYASTKTMMITLREDGLSCQYLYKSRDYTFGYFKQVEIDRVRLSKVRQRVLRIDLKDGTKVYIEYDGLWNCCEYLDFFKSKNVPIVKTQHWLDKIYLREDGKYRVKSD